MKYILLSFIFILISSCGERELDLRNSTGVIINNPLNINYNLIFPAGLQRRINLTYQEIIPQGLFKEGDNYIFQVNINGNGVIQGIRNISIINPRILNNQTTIVQWGPNSFGQELRLSNFQSGQFIEIEVFQNSLLVGRFIESF